MVSAVQGVLITCDVPLSEFVKSLNDQAPASEKFLIAELDDGSLFVKAARADEIRKSVKAYIDKLHYQRPEVAQGQQG